MTKYYDEPDPTGAFSSESVRFEYNAYGQRTLKEYVYDPGSDYSGDFLIGTTSEYTYDHSGRLVRELITDYFTESASVEKELIFLYDESGMIGVMYSYNGSTPTTYYYQRNLQGDVVAIYDTNGNKKASYTYDAFGNCTTAYAALYDIAYNNPIRYRGYYYDRETNFYYLNSRYYSPEWRRFISPDDTSYLDPENVNGLNLYCYCANDPVNYKHSLVSSVGSVVSSSISIGGSLNASSSVSNGSAPWWVSTVVGAIPDFILGMRYLTASGIHSRFAYATNTRYMHPIMGGTWRWFGKSSSSFGTVAQGTFKQILTGDARAGFGAIAKSIGAGVGLNALVNFGFNLYENNWQVDSAMLLDTAIDTAIGVGSYYLAAGTMSLATAGLLAAGVALLGAAVVCGLIILSVGFEHLIRAISGYWD